MAQPSIRLRSEDLHRAPARYCEAVRAEDATPGGSGRSAWSRYRRPPGRSTGQRVRHPSEQGHYLWNGLPFDPQKGVKLRRRNTREVTDLPPEQRRVGLMFQNFGMFPHLTVVGNVASGLRARRRGGHADAGRGIADLLSLFGISHLAIGIRRISVPLIAQKSAPLERFRSDGIKSGRAQKL